MGSHRRSMTAAVVALGLAAASVAVVALLPPPGARHPRTVRSESGGFEIVVPARWRAAELHDRQLARFERPLRARLGADAWIWVYRWSGGGDTVEDVQRRSSRWLREGNRTDLRYRRTTVGGRAALRVDHREPAVPVPGPLQLRVVVRRYQVPVEGHVFEIGISAWRDIPEAADRAARRAILFAPTAPIVHRREGFSLRVPPGWDEIEPEGGALVAALAPGTPAPAWVYVYRFEDGLEDSVARVRKAVARGGGTGLVRRDVEHRGRPAVRLEFTFPNTGPEIRPPTSKVAELLVPDDEGTFILALGSVDPGSTWFDQLVAGFRTSRRV